MEAVAVAEKVLDILFPPTCVLCGVDEGWMCSKCLGTIILRKHADEPTEHFESVLSCGYYVNPALRKLVGTFKYQSAFCLEQAIAEVARRYRDDFLDAWPWAGESDMVVTSVPTDPRHVLERGTDHAVRLANIVRDILVPWADRKELLKRRKKALPNASLPADETRAANMRGIFCMKNEGVPEAVLLVDDVRTTGATSKEAGETLKAAGVKRIYLFTLASGK